MAEVCVPRPSLVGWACSRCCDRAPRIYVGRKRRTTPPPGTDQRAARRARALRPASCGSKGRRPFIFGRGGEGCRPWPQRRRSRHEIVPGITTAAGARPRPPESRSPTRAMRRPRCSPPAHLKDDTVDLDWAALAARARPWWSSWASALFRDHPYADDLPRLAADTPASGDPRRHHTTGSAACIPRSRPCPGQCARPASAAPALIMIGEVVALDPGACSQPRRRRS